MDTKTNERRVMFASCLAHCMTHVYMLIFPALVMPLRRELGLSLGDALELAFLGYLLYGVGSLPAGYITDRWSARWMICLCLSITGAGSLMAGLSQSTAQLVIALCVIGLGASIYHPTGMALISRTFSDRRGWALGVNGVFGNVGLAAAPFVTGVLASVLGWRWAYGLLAIPGVLGALVVASLPMNESREDAKTEADAKDDETGPGLERYFILLCVAMTLGGLAYRSSSLIMPSYFEERASFLLPFAGKVTELLGGTGAKTAAATTLTSLVYVVGIVGQMIGGRVADLKDLRIGYILFHLLSIPAVIAMARLIEVPLFLAAMVYLLFSLGMQPIENSLVAKLTPARWRSTAYGLKFLLTFGIGAFAVGLVGFVERRSGLASVFLAVAALELLLVLFAGALWLLSRRALPSVRNS